MNRYKRDIGIGDKIYKLTNFFLNDVRFVKKRKFDRSVLRDFMQRYNVVSVPSYRDGQLFSSSVENEYFKVFKYHISITNSRLDNLLVKLTSLRKINNTYLKQSSTIVKGLASEIEELEIRYLSKKDEVHVNNFTKEKDKIIFTRNSLFRKDFKTRMPFVPDEQMFPFFNLGLTLPVRDINYYTVSNSRIINEETNVGDTYKQIFSDSDPNFIFRKNRIFRYAIVKSSQDTTSRNYKRKTSYDQYPYSLVPTLTIEMDLESYLFINFLKLEPISANGFSLKKMEYKSRGVYISVDIVEKQVSNKLFILFETFQTKKLKLTFEQKGSIENTRVIVSNKKSYYLNETVRGANFVSRVPEDYEDIIGYVYDFSIKDIHIGKVNFKNKGFLMSKEIETQNFISSSTTTESSYFGESFFIENYLGLSLEDKENNLLVEEVLSLPDNKTFQYEYLELRENIGVLKLFPDLEYNICKYRILPDSSLSVQLDQGNIPEWGIVSVEIPYSCFNPTLHLGYLVHQREKKSIYSRNDAFDIRIKMRDSTTSTSAKYALEADLNDVNTWEYLGLTVEELLNKYEYYIYDYTEDHTFFEVYKDQNLLTLKDDYEYSLNGGITWKGYKPNSLDLILNLNEKIAGNFSVRILNPNPKSVYSVRYKINKKQRLSKSNKIFLINEKIFLDSSLRNNQGYLQNLIIVRSPLGNSEEISILEKYRNEIVENKEGSPSYTKKKFSSKNVRSSL